MKHKITQGYVEQIFDDNGKLIEQFFKAGDHVEWVDGNGDPTHPGTLVDAYHPFDMVQTNGMGVVLVGNLSDGFTVVGPFAELEEALVWSESVDSWCMTMVSPYSWEQKNV